MMRCLRTTRSAWARPWAVRMASLCSPRSTRPSASRRFSISPAEAHEQADLLGNTFTDEMVDRIETQLGKPDRCPHGWPVDTDFEQAENRELQPLSDLAAGSEAEIVRLAEHDGDLLHWYYDEGLVPGTHIEVREADGGELTLSVGGDERPLDEKQAAGLFVRAT